MKNYLLSIFILIFCISCTSRYGKLKPEVGYFFKENLSDIKNNNNTASYGSIVGAKSIGYPISYKYFPSLGQNFRQKYLILHYTVSDNEKSIATLTSQKVSIHYLILDKENDKNIYQIVDENKRAYHAGESSWGKDKGSSLNDNSIGIEIVNPGYSLENGQMTFNVSFTELQFKKVGGLAKDIVTRYNIPPTNVLGHADIAPTRKQDPGPLFPWKRLYEEYQVGMWYDEETKKIYSAQESKDTFNEEIKDSLFIEKIQNSLQNLGYSIQLTKQWDEQTKLIIQAFQFHFRPQKYDGILDIETWSILEALLQKYRNKVN